jgi:hypothetical protein
MRSFVKKNLVRVTPDHLRVNDEVAEFQSLVSANKIVV